MIDLTHWQYGWSEAIQPSHMYFAQKWSGKTNVEEVSFGEYLDSLEKEMIAAWKKTAEMEERDIRRLQEDCRKVVAQRLRHKLLSMNHIYNWSTNDLIPVNVMGMNRLRLNVVREAGNVIEEFQRQKREEIRDA